MKVALNIITASVHSLTTWFISFSVDIFKSFYILFYIRILPIGDMLEYAAWHFFLTIKRLFLWLLYLLGPHGRNFANTKYLLIIKDIGALYLTLLSTVFQLYRGNQFY